MAGSSQLHQRETNSLTSRLIPQHAEEEPTESASMLPWRSIRWTDHKLAKKNGMAEVAEERVVEVVFERPHKPSGKEH